MKNYTRSLGSKNNDTPNHPRPVKNQPLLCRLPIKGVAQTSQQPVSSTAYDAKFNQSGAQRAPNSTSQPAAKFPIDIELPQPALIALNISVRLRSRSNATACLPNCFKCDE